MSNCETMSMCKEIEKFRRRGRRGRFDAWLWSVCEQGGHRMGAGWTRNEMRRDACVAFD